MEINSLVIGSVTETAISSAMFAEETPPLPSSQMKPTTFLIGSASGTQSSIGGDMHD